MPTTPTEPTSTNPVYTQRALTNVEEFLQRSGCSDHTKNAWLYLKNALHKLSTIQCTPPTSAQVEILKGLSAIEKRLSALSAPLLKAPSYANQACKAAPQGAHEKPVLEKALEEVTVKVIDDPKPSCWNCMGTSELPQ
jgi:threonine synthase